MTDIIKINDQTWRFEEEGVRFFLLTGKDKALLIDSGMMTPNARELAESVTDLPLELLNTHADRDHIAGNAAFDWCWMHPSEGIVYHNIQKHPGAVRYVWEGDVMDLGERELEIIHLPGHTPGSIAILDRKYRALISGDPIQTGQIYMFGLHRDLPSYVASLERLAARLDEFDYIYPSHAAFPVTPDLVPALIADAKKVLNGEIEPEVREVHGQQIKACVCEHATFLINA